jgi:hypothetical protein
MDFIKDILLGLISGPDMGQVQTAFWGSLIGLAAPLIGGLFGGDKKKQQQQTTQNTDTTKTTDLTDTQDVSDTPTMSPELAALFPFFGNAFKTASGWMDGSPTLAKKRASAFGDAANMYNKFAGGGQQSLFGSGWGFAPSGMSTAMEGNIRSHAARTASQNMLGLDIADEQFKQNAFQNLIAGLGAMHPLIGNRRTGTTTRRGTEYTKGTTSGNMTGSEGGGLNWGGLLGAAGEALPGFLKNVKAPKASQPTPQPFVNPFTVF